jgi:Holliday junction resolvase-like predicted endonuclease
MAAYVPPSPRTLAQRAGDAAEDDVAARLSARGWRILGRRVRAGRSELDLVAVDPGPPRTLVIVEVRWRRRRDFGLPEETVDHRKLAHLRGGVGRAASAGCSKQADFPTGRSCRISRSAWISWSWSHRRHPAVRRESATIEGSVDRTSRGGSRDPTQREPRPGRAQTLW